MAETQAPGRRSSRSSRSSGKNRKTASAPSTKAADQPTSRETNASNTNGASREATPAAEPAKEKTPKVYVFGGSVEAPQPGANARRLWRFLTGDAGLTKKQVEAIREEIAKGQPKDDRFVRWQRVVDACQKAGVETVKVGDNEITIGQALVRRLQQEDKGGEIGRDGNIVVFPQAKSVA